jgi:hypothetical protein
MKKDFSPKTHVFDASRPLIVAHRASREYINKNRRRGDGETGRGGDAEKGRQETRDKRPPSPFLPFSLSPFLPYPFRSEYKHLQGI